jgi:hypothetical protein
MKKHTFSISMIIQNVNEDSFGILMNELKHGEPAFQCLDDQTKHEECFFTICRLRHPDWQSWTGWSVCQRPYPILCGKCCSKFPVTDRTHLLRRPSEYLSVFLWLSGTSRSHWALNLANREGVRPVSYYVPWWTVQWSGSYGSSCYPGESSTVSRLDFLQSGKLFVQLARGYL